MDDLDSRIPLLSKAPDPMTSLASLLDVSAKSLSLQKSRQTFDADVARAKAESSTQQSAASVNSASIQARINQIGAESSTAQSGATVNAANVNPLIQQQAAQTATAQTGANKAGFDLQQHKVQTARQAIMELTQNKNLQNQDPSTYDKKQAISDIAKVRQFMLANGHDEVGTESIAARLMGEAGNAGGVMNMLHGQILAGTPSSATAQTISPNIRSTNLGNGVVNQDANQFSGTTSPNLTGTMTGGVSAGSSLPNSLGQPGYVGQNPVTPEQMGRTPQQPNRQPPASGFNASRGDALVGNVPTQPGTPQATPEQESRARMVSDIAGLKREIGRAPTADMKRILSDELSAKESLLSRNDAKPTPGFVGGGMPTGQAENIEANNKIAHTHFTNLASSVQNSQLLEGVVNNIKAFAPRAITGTDEQRLSFLNGVVAQFGGEKAKDLKSFGDMLSKNVAMLNQFGQAGTDAQNLMREMSQPHVTMTDKAMNDSADQVLGRIRSEREGYSQFLPEALNQNNTGRADNYLKKMAAWQKVSDPRVWQYESLTAEGKRAFMKPLSAEDQRTLADKADILEKEFKVKFKSGATLK